MRRVLALFVAPALLLAAAACGSGAAKTDNETKATTAAATGSIDDVKVSGAAGAKPTVTFDKPFQVKTTESKVIKAGKGEEVKKNDSIVVNYLGINARDGKEFDTSWQAGRQPTIFTLQDGALINGFLNGLVGKKIGDRVLISIASKDGYAEGNEQAGIKKGDSLLFVVDLLIKPATKAQGKAVQPAAGLPTVKLDKETPSAITVPKTDPPKGLKVQPLIEGTGTAIKKDSTVAVHMIGTNWRTGKTVESSWQKGQPYVLPLSQLGVPGLVEGLTGQKGGSRVLIVIPPDKGFKQDLQGTDVKKTDTLVFVVDVLGVV